MSDTQKFLIITCDGGGIRGLMSTLLLQDLGQEVLDRVNLWAGTSTGAAIALGLAGGMTIDDLVALYASEEFCCTLFTPWSETHAPGRDPSALAHETLVARMARAIRREFEDTIEHVEGMLDFISALTEPKYTEEGRWKVMQSLPQMTLEQVFSQRQRYVLVNTFRLTARPGVGVPKWLPVCMHNLPNVAHIGGYEHLSLAEAGMCSTAAPLFWQSYQLPGTDEIFADGGLFANNPATVSVSATIHSGVLGHGSLADIHLLSVGTGLNPATYPSQGGLPGRYPWGMLGWLWPRATDQVGPFPVLQAVFDSTSTNDSRQAAMLLGARNFRRADVDMGTDVIALDDCGAVDAMRTLTQAYIESDEWREIKAWVQETFV